MKIAFYKAFQKKATMLDNLIAVFTFGRYSHVELYFSNGESFSISPREGESRFKVIDYTPEAWDILDLKLTEDEEKKLYAIAKNEYLGFKYDYIGAVFSASPVCIQKDERLFCSEVATNIIRRNRRYYFLRDGCRYSPNELYKKIKSYCRKIELS